MKLCYVEDNIAFFTNASLSKQWGDDWNDAPYEHNAGEPYDDKSLIVRVYFDADYTTPDEGHPNSPYSVEAINRQATPWLRPTEKNRGGKNIWAGTSLDEFIDEVIASEGKIVEIRLATVG